MYISRNIEEKILSYLNTPEIIALVGPRQCGKTTLLKHIHDSLSGPANFITFEDKQLLDLFTKQLKEFIKIHIEPYKYIFIDEFQYARRGGKGLKYIFDTSPRKIFISGSSSADLTIQAIKFLVGRIFVFQLAPFDFAEYLSAKAPLLRQRYQPFDYVAASKPMPEPSDLADLTACFNEYAVFGGYPRVVLSKSRDEKIEVLKNIYNTYFLREVKDILGLVDDYKLAQMIKALALQIGNLVEYQEISRIADLSYQTVKSYLNFLQKTFISCLIKPFFINKRTEIVKNPKVYFYDTGLRNFIINDFRDLKERDDRGALLENGAAMQFLKKELAINFWRTKRQAEIDFIVNLPNNQRLAIEVKSTPRITDSVVEFRKKYPDVPLFLASLAPNEQAGSLFLGQL